jgi:hypothetical protein
MSERPTGDFALTDRGVVANPLSQLKNTKKRGKATTKTKQRNGVLYFALPTLLLAVCILQPALASAQMTSVGVDCSQINVQSLMMQTTCAPDES